LKVFRTKTKEKK